MKSVCIIVLVCKQSVLKVKQYVLRSKQSVWDYIQNYKQLNYQKITLKSSKSYIKNKHCVQVILCNIYIPTQCNMLKYNDL